MANLEQATERLQHALKQLEAAVESRRSGDDTLKADLRVARGENQRLQSAIEMASDRLDSTIERVKQLMES